MKKSLFFWGGVEKEGGKKAISPKKKNFLYSSVETYPLRQTQFRAKAAALGSVPPIFCRF